MVYVWDMDSPDTTAIWYLNGSDQGAPDESNETGTASAMSGIDSISLGTSGAGASPGGSINCAMADWAAFNSDIGAEGAAALASGIYSPFDVDSEGLFFYPPLTKWDGNDLISGQNPSSQGSGISTFVHPPIQQPTGIIPPPQIVPAPSGIWNGFSFLNDSTGAVHQARFQSKPVPVVKTVQVSDAAAEITTPNVASLAVEADGKHHPAWRRDSDTDLWKDTVDELTPGTDEVLKANITAGHVSATIFERGGTEYLGYVYIDTASGETLYDEFELAGITAYYKSLADSFTPSDVQTAEVGKLLAETATAADVLLRSIGSIRSTETVTASDAVLREAQALLTGDGVTLSTVTLRATELLLSGDALTISDAVTRAVQSVLSGETITLTDSGLRAVQTLLTTETVTITDSVDALVVLLKLLAETITVSENLISSTGYELGEALTVADVLARSPSTLLGETLAHADAILRGTDKVPCAETISLSAVVDPTIVIPKLLAETVTLSDAARAAVSSILTDGITVADATTVEAATRFANSLGFADNLLAQIEIALAEAVTLGDLLDSIIVTLLSLPETLTVTDARLAAVSAILADTATLGDARASAPATTKAETVLLTDDQTLKGQKPLPDTVDLSTDGLTVEAGKSLTASAVLSDGITAAVAAILAETLTITDVLTTYAQGVTQKLLAEGVTISDVITRATADQLAELVTLQDDLYFGFAELLAESFGLTDASSLEALKSLVASLTVGDATLRADASKFLQETAALADTRQAAVTTALVETLTATAALSFASGVQQFLQETMSLSDAEYNQAGKALSAALSLADSMPPVSIAKALGEALDLDDETIAAISFYLSDTLTVSGTAAAGLRVGRFIGPLVVYLSKALSLVVDTGTARPEE
jgi:hypothetical protein